MTKKVVIEDTVIRVVEVNGGYSNTLLLQHIQDESIHLGSSPWEVVGATVQLKTPSFYTLSIDSVATVLGAPADAVTLLNQPTGGVDLAVATTKYVNDLFQWQRSGTTLSPKTAGDGASIDGPVTLCLNGLGTEVTPNLKLGTAVLGPQIGFYQTEGVDSQVFGISMGGSRVLELDYDGSRIPSQLLYLSAGAPINKFSNDGTMAGNSAYSAVTEAAVVTYVGAEILSASVWTRTGTDIAPKTANDNLVLATDIQVNTNLLQFNNTIADPQHITGMSWHDNGTLTFDLYYAKLTTGNIFELYNNITGGPSFRVEEVDNSVLVYGAFKTNGNKVWLSGDGAESIQGTGTEVEIFVNGSRKLTIYDTVSTFTHDVRLGTNQLLLSADSLEKIYGTGTSIKFQEGGVDCLTLSQTTANFTGQLRAPNGSALSPSHAFGGETTSGMYRIGAGNIGFSCAQTKMLDLNTSGLIIGTGVRVAEVIDDGTMATATATSLSSSSSIVTYVASVAGNYIPLTDKGVANGVATLDGSGFVPASQLPSYVDDVIEAANFAALPVTGESGKIYITIDDGKTFRWTGSIYGEVSPSIGTDLSAGSTATTFSIHSSTGTSATITGATGSLAGIMVAADKTKLDAITGTNTGDQDLSGYALLSGAVFTGSISATNLSGTNTGDQDLSGLQPLDAGLSSIAGLTTAADTMIYTTASDTYATTVLTAFGRSLIDDADNTAARATLGLGTMAVATASDYALLTGAAFTGAVSATALAATTLNTGDQIITTDSSGNLQESGATVETTTELGSLLALAPFTAAPTGPQANDFWIRKTTGRVFFEWYDGTTTFSVEAS